MSSGPNNVIFNTRERVVSRDLNRLQQFSGAALAQVLMRMRGQRQLLSAHEAPGVTFDPALLTISDQVQHRVIGGCMVRCDAPGYLTVDAGSVAFYAPGYSTSTDDSDWVVVDDPGATSTVLLPFVANAGAGTRMDIVECRPYETSSLSENRDVYDASTSTYAPTLVSKASGAALTYRIRQGTAAAGLPAKDDNWCPLAVVAVTTTATGFTTCDVYDVRPLLDAAAQVPLSWDHASSPNNPLITILDSSLCGVNYDTSTAKAQGWWAAGFNGYLVGGPLYKTSPSASWSTTLVDFIDIEDTTNWSSNLPPTVSGNARNSLVCLIPSQFYRFMRYTRADYSGLGRIPRGPNGIFTICSGGSSANGNLGAGARMPAGVGCATETCYGPVVAEIRSGPTHLLGFYARGRDVTFPSDGYSESASLTPVTVTATIDTLLAAHGEFTFTPSTSATFSTGSIPADARYVWLKVTAIFTCTNSGVGYANTYAFAHSNADLIRGSVECMHDRSYSFTGTSFIDLYLIKVPVQMPIGSAVTRLYLQTIFGPSGTVTCTSGTYSCVVSGYER